MTTSGNPTGLAGLGKAKAPVDGDVPTRNDPTEAIESEDTASGEAPAILGKIYTCLPSQNWRIGPFKFQKGQLHLLRAEDIESFEKLLEGIPPIDRARIKTLDLGAADELAKNLTPRATRGFDGGLNLAADKLAKSTPKIGTLDQGSKESGN